MININRKKQGKKCVIVQRLVEYGLGTAVAIPDAMKQYTFWAYCPNLENQKRHRIIEFLEGRIPRGAADTEDIVLRVKRSSNVVEQKVFLNN